MFHYLALKQELYVPLHSNFMINKPDIESLVVIWYFQSGVDRVHLASIFNSTYLSITRRERTVVNLNGSLFVWKANYRDNGTFICEVGDTLTLFTTVIVTASTGTRNF